MEAKAISLSQLATKLERRYHNKYDEATEHLSKPHHVPCTVREYQKPDAIVAASLVVGSRSIIKLPVIKSIDNAIIFNPDYHQFHYDGLDRHINDWEGQPNPRGEHFVEKVLDNERGYTNSYHCIGHCPHGLIGDGLLYGDAVLVITDVFLTNQREGLALEWSLEVEPLDIVVTKH